MLRGFRRGLGRIKSSLVGIVAWLIVGWIVNCVKLAVSKLAIDKASLVKPNLLSKGDRISLLEEIIGTF